MRERIQPTRSGLFAIELLICVGIFSLCAAICVGLFVRSEIMSQDSADLSRAVNEARSAAECFKAAGGDILETARLTGGELAEGILLLHCDESLVLKLTPIQENGYIRAIVAVERGGENILEWNIAALEVAS